jgi:RNA polymerase sigma-70 factor, ECF subfamily
MTRGTTRDPEHGHLRVLPGGASPKALHDDQLVRLFLAGDSSALGELLQRHQHRVLTLVRRYASSSDAGRDLVQRTFLRALEAARRSLRSRGDGGPIPFGAWLLRIAANLGKNAVRDSARWRRTSLEALDGAASEVLGAEEKLVQLERERQVRAAVLTLPARQRQVLTLRIDAALSFREIAEALGTTEGNARVHFHHAVRRLRGMLQGAAGSAP